MTKPNSDVPARSRRTSRPAPQLQRLTVNLTEEAERALEKAAEMKGITRTEAVRRAIAIANFFDEELAAGRTIQTVDEQGRVREPVIL